MIALVALVALVGVFIPGRAAFGIIMYPALVVAADATELPASRRRGCRIGCCCRFVASTVLLRILL